MASANSLSEGEPSCDELCGGWFGDEFCWSPVELLLVVVLSSELVCAWVEVMVSPAKFAGVCSGGCSGESAGALRVRILAS